MKAFLIDLIVSVVFRILEKLKLRHVSGYSDGTTEEKLKDKIKKDGWG